MKMWKLSFYVSQYLLVDNTGIFLLEFKFDFITNSNWSTNSNLYESKRQEWEWRIFAERTDA
jgi:hypothetical protein